MNFLQKLTASGQSKNEYAPPDRGRQIIDTRSSKNQNRSRSPFKTIHTSFQKLFGSVPTDNAFIKSREATVEQNPEYSVYRALSEQPSEVAERVTVQRSPNVVQSSPFSVPSNDVNLIKQKLKNNKKESENREQTKSQKAFSITAKDNMAYMKSKLKQGSSKTNVAEERNGSFLKNLGSKKLRLKKEKKYGSNSATSVSSEPIMSQIRSADGSLYQSIASEYQLTGFPNNETGKESYQTFSASTGQIQRSGGKNRDRGHYFETRETDRVPRRHVSHHQLYDSNQMGLYSHQNLNRGHKSPHRGLYNRKSLDPSMSDSFGFYPLTPKYQSQPAIHQSFQNYHPPNYMGSSAISNPGYYPAQPDKPHYMRSVSNQEMSRNQNNFQSSVLQLSAEFGSMDLNNRKSPLRVPLGLQHQFSQPAPIPLQKAYDMPDSTYSASNYSERNSQGNSQRKRDQLSHRQSKPSDQITEPSVSGEFRSNRQSPIPPRVMSKSEPSLFRGESDAEDELEDDVFFEPEPLQPLSSRQSQPIKDDFVNEPIVASFSRPIVLNAEISMQYPNPLIGESLKRSGEQALEFEKLKQELNEAMRQEEMRSVGKTRRKHRNGESSSKLDNVERNAEHVSEEHQEFSSTNNSGLGEPFASSELTGRNIEYQTEASENESSFVQTRKNTPANESHLLNESELNLDTSYSTNLVKIDKFLQTLEPVTEAYFQTTPASNDLYSKKQRRRNKNGSDASSRNRSRGRPASPGVEKSPIEMDKLQQVRRRVTARMNGDVSGMQRPVTPPSQRSSRKNRTIDRCLSAPPDQLETTMTPFLGFQLDPDLNYDVLASPFQRQQYPDNFPSLYIPESDMSRQNEEIMFV